MGRGRSKAGGGSMMLSGLPPSLAKQEQIDDLKQQLAEAKGIFAKARLNDQIEMLESGFEGTLEEYREQKRKEREEKVEKAKQEQERRQKEADEAKRKKEEQAKQQLENEMKTQPKDKVEQYKIIQENNPANDDYHTWIRKPSDIKTWSEVVKEESSTGENLAWGDFSLADAKQALKDGKIRVYSSYKIDQGIFVSTSRAQAEWYAGGTGHKVYSKIVPLEDVAWINGDEGQYANLKKKRK